jgi:hypothetical protein
MEKVAGKSEWMVESIHRDLKNEENMGQKFQHSKMFGMQDKLSLDDWRVWHVYKFLEYYGLIKEIPDCVNFSTFVKAETEFQIFRKYWKGWGSVLRDKETEDVF